MGDRHFIADARLVRRVVKRQRGLAGFGLEVPHGHCCVIDRAPLLAIVTESELGTNASALPDTIILVARPDRRHTTEDGLRDVWRRVFHGHVHHHLERRVREGSLTAAVVRERIHRIGQTEFDEIRTVLRGEELLFAGGDDRETYIEFAAFYSELRHFDPDALTKLFPTIRDAGPVVAALALDLDCAELITQSRPKDAPELTALVTVAPVPSLPAPTTEEAPPSSRRSAAERTAVAAAAKEKGNVVRSILERMADGDAAAEDVEALAVRLHGALDLPGESAHGGAAHDAPAVAAWSEVAALLARAAIRARSPRALEARVLHDMQKACIDAERGRSAVDVVTWLTSLTRRPIVRPLPAVRSVRVLRHLHHAFTTAHRASLSQAERKTLEEVFHAALARAKDNARHVVKPALEKALDDVGLHPKSVPEHVAREKLCEEVLDLVVERGSLGLSQLRDALSRSNLKLPNVSASDLLNGDPLLKSDALLSRSLDGVYRSGEVYLRGLQKVSSVAFGSRVGRLVTLHGVLPLLLSFVLLEGLQHVAHPIGKAFGHRHIHLLTPASFVSLTLLFYGVIHRPAVRAATVAVLRGIGAVLYFFSIGLPLLFLRSSPVRALLRTRLVSLATKSALLAGAAYLVARRAHLDRHESLFVAGGLLVATAVFLATPPGFRFEELVTDIAARRLRELSRRVLPGLFALLLDMFRVFVERTERAIYTVDEWLTFKQGQSTFSLVAKGALGFVWFLISYLLRVYVNVLVEPQVNPIKHFPVVTVSHKIILPLSPTILEALRQPLLPLGAVVANTVAGSTVFLLPGAFGFLVWELKENWNLYDQNRAKSLGPVRIGHHGETMNALLVVGFHAGTIPKLYGKIRRNMKRSEAKVNSSRAELYGVEHALQAFIERELVGLLRHARRWTAGDLVVHGIEVGSNRIRVGIRCPAVAPDPAWLHFEEQSGMLVASVATQGFVTALDDEQRATFEIALAGLYKRAGVDIVREQIEALIGKSAAYDVADEGLVVWPSGYKTEIVYDLKGKGMLPGVVRGDPMSTPPAPLEADRLLFSRQSVAWSAWVEAFGETATPPLGTLIAGPSLLPSGDVADQTRSGS